MAVHHFITCEYPPQMGGVSDYTRLVAEGLAAAGDEVHVWCPALSAQTEASLASGTPNDPGVFVHRELGRFSPGDFHRAGSSMNQFCAPRRILVQWVPHGYGYQSLNLVFCLWLWWRAKIKRDRVDLMVHEPFLGFGDGSRKQDLAALVHRLMITVLLHAARNVWVSIPEWQRQLQPFTWGRKCGTALPVPSNIVAVHDPDGTRTVRAQYALPGTSLIGHFGSYDRYQLEVLLMVLPELVGSTLSVLLIGNGSDRLRDQLVDQNPGLGISVKATGALAADDISRHIGACDLMLQPYEDGVSGRRTSVMTALVHGIPVVTTMGKATENMWGESSAMVLVKPGDTDELVSATKSLLANEEQRARISKELIRLYEERFAVEHTVSALRGAVNGGTSPSLALAQTHDASLH